MLSNTPGKIFMRMKPGSMVEPTLFNCRETTLYLSLHVDEPLLQSLNFLVEILGKVYERVQIIILQLKI